MEILLLNQEPLMKLSSLCAGVITLSSVAFAGLFNPSIAQAQLLPQPWVTVGAKDSSVTYSAGVRLFDLGAEFGTGPNGATGVDVLKFISLPVVSPYVGLGLYSGKESIAYSGGVQVAPPGNVYYGLGYHSIRGINGQVGLRF
jgi:hypothetical protein